MPKRKLGVHSEVGRLRKVLVHRPDLSLRRLTPSNCSELLFDDVVWVRRAKEQHDEFVACMRDQGVEVFYLRELLAEAITPDEVRRESHRTGGDGVHGRHRCGRRDSVVPLRAGSPVARHSPHWRAHRGRSRRSRLAKPLPGSGGSTQRRLHPAAVTQLSVHPRFVVLDLQRGESSTRCSSKRESANRSTSQRSTTIIRCLRAADFRFWYPASGAVAASHRESHGTSESRGWRRHAPRQRRRDDRYE